MDRLTAVRGEVGTGWKEVKGLAKQHTCMTCGHRQQFGGSQKEGGVGAGHQWAKGWKWGHL